MEYILNMIQKRNSNNSISPLFLGYFRFPVEEPNELMKQHDHKNGTINFCEKCWWKEIYSIDRHDLIYISPKECTCGYKADFHREQHVKICRLMKSIEWNCTKCSLDSKSNVRHLYIYPNKIYPKKILKYFILVQ